MNDSLPKRANIVVAVSGSGRSLKNFIVKQSELKTYKVVGVVSSAPECGAIKIANEANIEVYVGDFSSNNASHNKTNLYRWLDDKEADWLVLAGFLKPLPIHKGWNNRIINIHPSLLPKYGGKGFYGMKVHKAVIAGLDKESGASVHFVNDQYDEGRLIAQSPVAVFHEDKPEDLASRVFDVERKLYPAVLSELILKTLPLPNGDVKIYDFK